MKKLLGLLIAFMGFAVGGNSFAANGDVIGYVYDTYKSLYKRDRG